MKTSITKIFTFEASHSLPNHNGKCANLHGHSYKLEVTVSGQIKKATGESDEGMIMDFADIKKIVKENILDTCDHQNLNDIFEFVTTAENIAVHFMNVLMSAGLNCTEIKLWETATSFARVSKK